MRAIVATIVLASCNPDIDAHPHHQPGCDIPAVGDTCAIPVTGEAAYDAVDAAAWCLPGADLLYDARPGWSFEWACAPPPPHPWRIVVGVVHPGWGAAYLTPDGTLVNCNEAGRVISTHPMLTNDSGRVFQAIEPEDYTCLDDGTCVPVSDPCGISL